MGAGGNADTAWTVAHLQAVKGSAGAAFADLGHLNTRPLAQTVDPPGGAGVVEKAGSDSPCR